MTPGAPAACLGKALTGPGRASIAAAARAVLHAGGRRGATVTLPPGIPPHLRRKDVSDEVEPVAGRRLPRHLDGE